MSTRVQVGQVFGRWTVVRLCAPKSDGERMRRACMVRCICGSEREQLEKVLRQGRSRGCAMRTCMRRAEDAEVMRRAVCDAVVAADVCDEQVREAVRDAVNSSLCEYVQNGGEG